MLKRSLGDISNQTNLNILNSNQNEFEKSDDPQSKIYELEIVIGKLNNRIIEEKELNANLQSQLRSKESENEANLKELEILEINYSKSNHNVQDLNNEVSRLAKEKVDLLHELNEAREYEIYVQQCRELETDLTQARNIIIQQQQDISELSSENDNLTENIERLQSENKSNVKTIEIINEELIKSRSTLENLTIEVNALSVDNDQLTERLNILEPKQAKLQLERGEKTLFADIEDRRQELESKHTNLKGKHASLIRAHTVSVYQTERMRTHITRLTQLSTNQDNDAIIKSLKDQLDISESEKQVLNDRLTVLESKVKLLRKQNLLNTSFVKKRKLSGSKDDEDDTTENIKHEFNLQSNDDNSVLVECLRLEIKTYEKELNTLKNEVKTLKLVRSNDLDKIKIAELNLQKSNEEIRKLKNVIANMKFKADDFKGNEDDISTKINNINGNNEFDLKNELLNDSTPKDFNLKQNDEPIDKQQNISKFTIENLDTNEDISLKTASLFAGRVSDPTYSVHKNKFIENEELDSERRSSMTSSSTNKLNRHVDTSSTTQELQNLIVNTTGAALINGQRVAVAGKKGIITSSSGGNALRERAEPTHVKVNRSQIRKEDCRQQ